MQIEIVEFYPDEIKSNFLKGSMHVYIVEEKIDLRGWMVIKNKETWLFHLPSKVGKDPETSKLIRYPTFAYNDPEKAKNLFELVRVKGIEYITKFFLTKE